MQLCLLERLDVSHNVLQKLPADLLRLELLVELCARANMLRVPPQAVCDLGLAEARAAAHRHARQWPTLAFPSAAIALPTAALSPCK